MACESIEAFEMSFDEVPSATPSKKVPDGPLCGNGDIGTVAAADVKSGSVSFYIGKNDIWNAYSYWDEAGMRGYGRLQFCAAGMENAVYSARQNLQSAEVAVRLAASGRTLSIECKVLRKSNLILHRLICEGGSADIELSLVHTRRKENVTCLVKAEKDELTGYKIFAAPEALWPTQVHSITKVLGADMEAGPADTLRFHLHPRECITVVTVLYTNGEISDCTGACETAVQRLTHSMRDEPASVLKSYERVHDNWWKQFWEKSGIEIPSEPLLERYWHVSHYLMACCCEEGKYAPGIFGNWNTTDEPAWGGDYHLNYNYEAPWWGLYSSNHIDICESYARPLMEYMETARKAAGEKLNCRGLYMPVGIGPKGLKTSAMIGRGGSDDVNYWGQKSNAAYAALNMVMQFYYTLDEEYVRKTAYPFVSETVRFWEDYLDWEDNRYVIHNDCIHENGALVRGLVDWADGNEPDYGDDCNSVLTLGLLRTLLQGLLDMGDMLNYSPEDQRRWKHILDHLSEFPTMIRNGEKVFRYTESGREWRDDNSLGIQHVFPAGCIGLGSEPELLQTARNMFRQMARWDDYNAFPTYFTAGVRLGMEPEPILQQIKKQIVNHGLPNGFISFGGGGIECCSTVPTVLNEMLLQSHEQVIWLFPVWDLNKDAAFWKLRAYGAFLVSAQLTDTEIRKLTIVSEKGKTCRISLPYAGILTVTCTGEHVEVMRYDGIYEFPTSTGAIYECRVTGEKIQ